MTARAIPFRTKRTISLRSVTLGSERAISARPSALGLERAAALRAVTSRSEWTVPTRAILARLEGAITRRAPWTLRPVFAWGAALFVSITPGALGEAAAFLVARHLEAVARILVFAARTPVAAARLAATTALLPQPEFRRFLRRPELSSREPHHRRVRMPRLKLLERRQQFLTLRSTKCGGLSAGDDRPVHVTRRHGQAFGAAGGSSRFSFSINVVRLRLSSFAACRLLPCVRSSERRMSESSTVSM